MASNSREERRRKIMERGSDRLALITGQISDLPPSSSPPINAVFESANNAPASTLIKREMNESQRQEPQLNINSKTREETSRETLQASAMNYVTKTKASDDEHPIPKPSMKRHRIFTSRRLKSCIVTSERTRSFCALIIALLVVLSYADDAFFGINLVSSDVLTTRPLYIILVTDVAIVLALTYLQAREDEKLHQNKDGQHLDGAIRLMERGLMVYQAIGGLFTDFSVYAVVVICGLSLV